MILAISQPALFAIAIGCFWLYLRIIGLKAQEHNKRINNTFEEARQRYIKSLYPAPPSYEERMKAKQSKKYGPPGKKD